MTCSTFHSLCLRILKQMKWIQEDTTICDRKEQKKIIEECVVEWMKKKKKKKNQNETNNDDEEENDEEEEEEEQEAEEEEEETVQTDNNKDEVNEKDEKSKEKSEKAKMKEEVKAKTTQMYKIINAAKSRGNIPDEYVDDEAWIFQRYEDKKKQYNCIDFNDMIFMTIKKLEANLELANRFSRR